MYNKCYIIENNLLTAVYSEVENVIADKPISFHGQLIDNDMVAPAVISGVMLGLSALMFVILVPLSK